MTFNLLGPNSSFCGYGGSEERSILLSPCGFLLGGGGKGIVDAGFGEDKAKTRAAAVVSAYVLNSAKGVIFPGYSTAPPMTRIFFARIRIWGACEAASAILVRGPIAIIEIVSGGFSSRIRRISR